MLSTFKNKIVIFLFLLLLLIVGAIYYLRQQQPAAPTDTRSSLPSLNLNTKDLLVKPNVDNILETISKLPENTTVYQINPAKITHQQALDIAVKLGFSGSPQISQSLDSGQTYIWQTAQNYLTITTDEARVGYGLDLIRSPKVIEGKLASEEEIQKAATDFLQNQIVPVPKEVQTEFESMELLKVSGPVFQPVKSLKEANVAEVRFAFKLNGLKICNFSGNTSFITLTIGPEMKIVKFDFQQPFTSAALSSEYPGVDKNNLLETIKNKARIVVYDREDFTIPGPYEYQEIKTINFTQAQLAYFIPQKPSSYLQPVLLINGSGKIGSANFNSNSIYPVIQEKYYSEVK